MSGTEGHMRVSFLNVNSIRAHVGQIRQFLAHRSYHLFGVVETWLGPEVDDHLVGVDGYSLVRQDRNVNGGGVALYVRSTLKVKILETSKTTALGKPGIPEYLICSVQEGDLPPVLVSVIYRPPKVAFYSDPGLVNALRDLCDDYSHKIVMGDLNADLLDSDDAKTVRRLADDLSLRIVHHGSTHHPPTSATWIDVILTDKNDVILDYRNDLMTFRSKHNVIDVAIEYNISSITKSDFSYRDYRSITPQEIVETLVGCDWSAFHSLDFDIDRVLDCLSANLAMSMELHAPVKTIRPRDKRPPWIGTELQPLIIKRNATHRRYKRIGSAALLEEFLRLCDVVEDLSEQARASFLQDQLSTALDEKKDMWKEMRKLGLLPRSAEELHGFSPEVLNTHFASTFISLDE